MRAGLTALALASLIGAAAALPAGDEAPSLGDEEKAALILRIAQFTDWPANLTEPTAPFVIGVVGADPVGSALDRTAAGQAIAERAVVVKHFDSPQRLDRADLLFVSRSQRGTFEEIRSKLGSSPTLTVADYEGFARQGGAIELFEDAGRLRFRVNRRAAAAAGLNLRAQLLRSAAQVE